MHAEGWDHYLDRLERVVLNRATPGRTSGPARSGAPRPRWSRPMRRWPCMQPVLRGLTRRADRPKPTPCADFSCHEVAEHLMTSLAQLGAMAGVTVTPPRKPGRHSRTRSRRWPAEAIDALACWSTSRAPCPVPAVGETAGGIRWPASCRWRSCCTAGTWPQASGQRFQVSDEVVAYLRRSRRGIVPGGRGSILRRRGHTGAQRRDPDRAARRLRRPHRPSPPDPLPTAVCWLELVETRFPD